MIGIACGWPSPRAHAADLLWSAPPECDDRLLEREVERVLGKPIEAIDARAIEARIRRDAAGQFTLELRTWRAASASAPARRELQATDCEELVEAAAVAIAVAANSRTQAETLAPRPIERPKPPVPAPVDEPEAKFALGAGGLLDVGSLPSAAWGLEAQFAVAYTWLRVMLFAGALPDQRRALGGDRDVEFSLMFGRALACGQWPLPGADLYACGGFELGRLRANVTDLVSDWARARGWRAFAALVGVSYPLGSILELTAHVGVSAPLTRDDFRDGDRVLVHRPTAVGGRIGAGLTIAW